jgi:hypothetical protein
MKEQLMQNLNDLIHSMPFNSPPKRVQEKHFYTFLFDLVRQRRQSFCLSLLLSVSPIIITSSSSAVLPLDHAVQASLQSKQLSVKHIQHQCDSTVAAVLS